MKKNYPIFHDYNVLDELYIGSNSIIYRAESSSGNQRVILKIPVGESPSPRIIAGIRQEYELLKNIHHPNIVRAYSVVQLRKVPMLIREDFSGLSLSLMLDSLLPIEIFLTLAIQMTEAIGVIHKAGIIHKDIKPGNFIVHPKTLITKLTDFSISSILPREIPNLEHIEGTLKYISPEQTGRINHSVDFRTDFYSLGASFYEMLSGSPPFDENDPSILIHAHLARSPKNLTHSQVPEIISNIVLKLLAKDPSERYQSADGLKRDLTRCLQDFKKGKLIIFPVGVDEEISRFQIPEKLYGREKEVVDLINVFENIIKGNREIVFVSGYSGVGKTALINEVHKPISREQGRFITGKFDQFKRNIPYAAIIQAFQDLIKGILVLNKEDLHFWKTKIQNSIGDDISVIVDVLPDLGLIIDSYPPARSLPAHEAQKRFHELFHRFVCVFTDRPLILFLDDLQWADISSLELLESLVYDVSNLMFIGAYRDNEINSIHPFSQLKSRMEHNLKVIDLKLKPLSKRALRSLLFDTLRNGNKNPDDKNQIYDLCDLVMEKTSGNPFFVNQFLKTLAQNNLIYYENKWLWDLNKIRLAGLTDNVVELMADRIRLLPDHSRRTLSLAAAIGAKFSLFTLAIVSQSSPRSVFQNLWDAIRAGFLLPVDEKYQLMNLSDEELNRIEEISIEVRFIHDRVQQAAYSLLPAEQISQVHLNIGRSILKDLGEDSEKIFEIVNHLNYGHQVINNSLELNKLALLNLKAAKKAKDSIAYESAIQYSRQGLGILSLLKNIQPEIEFPLIMLLGESLYLRGEFSLAEEQFANALICSRDQLERAQVQNLRVVLYTSRGEYKQAIIVGREALGYLEFSLPEKNFQMQIMKLLREFEKIRNNRQIEDIYTQISNEIKNESIIH